MYLAACQDESIGQMSTSDVYDVADYVGNAYGPELREDILERYHSEGARSLIDAWHLRDAEAASRRAGKILEVASHIGASVESVELAVADAYSGRPAALDRMFASYFGR
jgi:hypothetical protein